MNFGLGQSSKISRREPGQRRDGEDALTFARNVGFIPDELQLRLLEEDSHRLLLNCTRQWGKSTVTALKAVHHAYTRADSLTLVMSPTARQTSEFMRKARVFLGRVGIRARGDGGNEISAALPNGSRLVGLPGTADTSRGYSGVSLLVIDEAAFVSDEQYDAVRPSLAASDGALWMMSTPRAKTGFFYEAWANSGEEWKRLSARATDCSRISARFLERERRSMDEQTFRREYMCEFADGVDMLFTREMVDAAFSEEVQPLAA
jgi:Terminase large subunit, T4likevirus-type, N-terminal